MRIFSDYPTDGSVKDNALVIVEEVEKIFEEEKKKVILIGYSKGFLFFSFLSFFFLFFFPLKKKKKKNSPPFSLPLTGSTDVSAAICLYHKTRPKFTEGIKGFISLLGAFGGSAFATAMVHKEHGVVRKLG